MKQPSGGSLGLRIWRALTAVTRSWHHLWRRALFYMPKRLYARSLLIAITPMILLQSVLAFVFMERHWQTVTVRLSQAVTRDIASIIDLLNTFPSPNNYAQIIRISQEQMSFTGADVIEDRLVAVWASAISRPDNLSSRSST